MRMIDKINFLVTRAKIELYKKQSRYLLEGRRTSLSDAGDYPVFCDMASENDRVFSTFRRNPIYNVVLEHVSYEQGLKYAEIIDNRSEGGV